MKRIFFLVLLSSFIFSCTPTAPVTQPLVNVYATPAAQPFLEGLYACADAASVTLNLTTDSPQITLRLGLPDEWVGSVYQIGSDEIVVAANLHSPLGTLTLEQARALFAGQGEPSVQVWAYASSEDVQRAFDQAVMAGRSVTSLARLAVSPLDMSDALSKDPAAVGILPRQWMTDQLRELFAAAEVPALALTPAEPEGIVRELIACLQQ